MKDQRGEQTGPEENRRLSLTSAGVHEVDGKVVGAVFDFELVEENSQHLRRRHAAVDADVGHRAVSRREHGCLRG